MHAHLAWLLSWLPWWLGYWPLTLVMPVLLCGWGAEAVWVRWRPGTAWLGEWPEGPSEFSSLTDD